MSKKKDPTKLTEWVTFMADASLRDQLAERAKLEDRPRSWVIRQLLLRALAANEKTA